MPAFIAWGRPCCFPSDSGSSQVSLAPPECYRSSVVMDAAIAVFWAALLCPSTCQVAKHFVAMEIKRDCAGSIEISKTGGFKTHLKSVFSKACSAIATRCAASVQQAVLCWIAFHSLLCPRAGSVRLPFASLVRSRSATWRRPR